MTRHHAIWRPARLRKASLPSYGSPIAKAIKIPTQTKSCRALSTTQQKLQSPRTVQQLLHTRVNQSAVDSAMLLVHVSLDSMQDVAKLDQLPPLAEQIAVVLGQRMTRRHLTAGPKRASDRSWGYLH